MSERLPFLFELGVEEIPHWMITPALAELEKLFAAFLEENRLGCGAVRLDATPRRLVLRADGIEPRQQDREEVVMGPPKSAGPGAAMGFAKKNGVAVEDLGTETTAKGEYFALRRTVTGKATKELLSAALPALIARIPWPKAMYWTGKDGVRFIRPIRWVACLLGDQIVEFEGAGIRSGALSCGHRRMGSCEIAFDHTNYEERLKKNGVILSAAERKNRIESGIKKVLKGTGYTLVADAALLDDLVYLTEFPTPILGSFDPKFLDLPREVLTTVMRHHQRYFTLSAADGSMAPAFVAVMNIKGDRLGYVRKGNERVLEARFNDARFFWEFDQQKPIATRVDGLKSVTFQARLGSYHDKAGRMKELAASLAQKLGADEAACVRAAELAKCDLTTEMVKELTELQGVMGGLYARSQGEPEEVAQAIYSHYLPQSMEDPIPPTLTGQVVSLADKLDTLTACFSIGMIPSGSKDPFALRRAAQGVVKILVEGRLALSFDGLPKELSDFLWDRVRYYFRDIRNFRYDEINAVLAASPANLVDCEDRLFALRMVRQTENFEPLAGSFKRISNILKQAGLRAGDVRIDLLEHEAEKTLYDEVEQLQPQVQACIASRDYIRALQMIATLRPAVDRFFDDVLVNAPDPGVRANRLSLLGLILNAFSSVADFSEIVTESTSESSNPSSQN
ncbi:MAG TPA: glycine--tRNA ligase subunit beta [Bryobacteraceae bacterium]|nr:glycine--tRNA ligase subunit beta [Bryobacteraceae bacterium]